VSASEPGSTPFGLSEIEALIGAQFPHHDRRGVRLGTQWRFILEHPGKSKMFAVTDTVIAQLRTPRALADEYMRLGARSAIEKASATDVVVMTTDGLRIDAF